MKTSGETLLSLIEEILDFSKIEAGRLDLEARPFDLPAWSRRWSNCWRRARRPRASRSHPMSTTGCRARVIGDAARLRQVLLNLAGNAIKFTDHGGVAIVVEPRHWPDEIALLGARHRHRHRARRAASASSTNSSRPTAARRASMAAPASASPSSRRIVERMGGAHRARERARRRLDLRVRGAAAASRRRRYARASAPPDLARRDIMIVAPSRCRSRVAGAPADALGRTSSRSRRTQTVAQALLPERAWSAVLVDHALGGEAMRRLARATAQACRAASCWSRRPSARRTCGI